MSRKTRSDSITAALQSAQGVAVVDWPETVERLSKQEDAAMALRIFCEEIIPARTKANWTKYPMDVATDARLSNAQVMASSAQAILDKSGPVIFSGKNKTTPVPNPALMAFKAYASLAEQLKKSLHISLNVSGARSDSRHAGEAAGMASDMQDLMDNDLLARPN